MAKHRFPIRVRAAREGIRSGRRLAITSVAVLALGGAGAGMALASSGSAAAPPASSAISASTSVSNHPDTTSVQPPTVQGPACINDPTRGPVWALDSYDSILTAVNSGSGTWNVTIQDKGSFAGFADPGNCNALKSKGSLVGLYHVTVTSATAPNPADLHSSYTTESTTQMVDDFFGGGLPANAINGGDYFFVYQNGNYVQTTSSLYGDVVASH